MNKIYDDLRSIALFLMEGRDLTLNLTRLVSSPIVIGSGFSVSEDESWAPQQLGTFLNFGKKRIISVYRSDIAALQKEILKQNTGYLVAQPRFIDPMLQSGGAEFFKKMGLAMWIPVSEEADANLREEFARLAIPVRATYSATEVGPIGDECPIFPGNYHVATSNVIVEVDSANRISVENKKLGRVLLTHLHSYATPIIRYDVGDLASLSSHCQCGHDGPTLSNLYGRKKRLLKRSNGEVLPFLVKGGKVREIANCSEYRVRQTDLTTLILEIGGVENISSEQTQALHALLKSQSGDEFNIVIRPVQSIDWGSDIKKLAFRSDVM
jgi:phenylacetate-coenzyme A ligase PaaK-like adenylate-forming protein